MSLSLLKLIIFVAVVNESVARIGDITVKFSRFDCMKLEDSKFCSNITCIFKPLNRTATMLSAACVEKIARTLMMAMMN